LLSKAQVLLLDEPTNHLDFETVEALAHALQRFAGTVFFICHDRTFVNLVATNILEVNNGKVERYPGKYEDYVYHLESVAREERGERSAHLVTEEREKSKAPATATSRPKEKADEVRLQKTVLKPEITKLKKRANEAEQRMKHCTEERDKLLEEIRKNPFFHSKDRNKRLKELQAGIEEAETEWYSLQEKLNTLDL